MDIGFPIDPKELRKINFLKYKGIPPSPELIDKVINRSGLKMMARFEFVYGIFKDAITWHKNGIRTLPARYWHIFYDFDTVNQMYSKLHKKSKQPKKRHTILHTNNSIVDAIK